LASGLLRGAGLAGRDTSGGVRVLVLTLLLPVLVPILVAVLVVLLVAMPLPVPPLAVMAFRPVVLPTSQRPGRTGEGRQQGAQGQAEHPAPTADGEKRTRQCIEMRSIHGTLLSHPRADRGLLTPPLRRWRGRASTLGQQG